MSGRFAPGGGTGVVVTVGATGGRLAGGGAMAGAGADGAGVGPGATGGSAWGGDGRWAPAGTGGLEPGGIVGGTMGVATLAGGIGVVVGKGVCSRGLCDSGGGMTATPDGMDGRLDGNSNFGVS
ncbi:hypothetical protein [Reyranella sp.]|uniref:hypothetical protein n=1 Tax=Reyranella sp. TaxID=1929291 RepID=UPI0027260306|nr:hypothetical protein [Reyranella sp.]MDO8973115.1 hypothetical protein [Reyranella sp.]